MDRKDSWIAMYEESLRDTRGTPRSGVTESQLAAWDGHVGQAPSERLAGTLCVLGRKVSRVSLGHRTW